jgi:hypothetical protein
MIIGELVATALELARYRANVNGPFQPTRLVWSRGLALLCDHNGGVDFVKRQHGGWWMPPLRFDPRRYAGITEGDLVWVRLTALPQFAREVLPNVSCRFGLVTGDQDWAIPSGYRKAGAILRDERVARWFTQNNDGTAHGGKVLGIPIGIDFHTISNRRKWGHWPRPPQEQEAQLQRLVAGALPTSERRLQVHADFHFNRHRFQTIGDRREHLEALLRRNPCVTFQRSKVRRLELWREKTRYAFVVSPHGNGLDCHRTWESLALGNIVIVRRSSMDALYEGLPVVIVDDWREITRENLRHWRDRNAGAFNAEEVQRRLTNDYWIGRMRAELAQELAR